MTDISKIPQPDFAQGAYVCEPTVNLTHRQILEQLVQLEQDYRSEEIGLAKYKREKQHLFDLHKILCRMEDGEIIPNPF